MARKYAVIVTITEGNDTEFMKINDTTSIDLVLLTELGGGLYTETYQMISRLAIVFA